MAELRRIPSIDQLRRRSSIRALESRFGGRAVVDALREGAAAVRESMPRGDRSLADDGAIVMRIESLAAARLDEQFRPSLQPAINATGVIIHTNLGRAPLSEAAVERVASVARGYSTLEYGVASGGRGRRDAPTGVVTDTTRGRAPLSEAAVERVASVARGYSTLEYDVASGGRGRRDVHAEALLCRLTGAEARVVVNNNAAGTMIVLAALATGRG